MPVKEALQWLVHDYMQPSEYSLVLYFAGHGNEVEINNSESVDKGIVPLKFRTESYVFF